MNAMIVDDEPLARQHIRRALEAQNVAIVAEAENAPQALELAEDLHPDILFLDIRMPGLTGLQMTEALNGLDQPPLIVFVTGYSEHAVSAFEHDALDYLLKPVDPVRLAKCLVRARERLSLMSAGATGRAPLEKPMQASPAPMLRLPIRGDYSVSLIRVSQILCALSRDKRVLVRTADGEHRTYYSLNYLESVLPQACFIRIHDSAIVNLECIEKLHFLGNHAYEIELTGGMRLPVARSRYAEVQRRLGLDASSSSRE